MNDEGVDVCAAELCWLHSWRMGACGCMHGSTQLVPLCQHPVVLPAANMANCGLLISKTFSARIHICTRVMSIRVLLAQLQTAQAWTHCCMCDHSYAALSQVDASTPVAIYAEGKEVAMAVGLTKMSTQEMREVNKGIGVELMHHLNDGLWKTHKMA